MACGYAAALARKQRAATLVLKDMAGGRGMGTQAETCVCSHSDELAAAQAAGVRPDIGTQGACVRSGDPQDLRSRQGS